MAGNDRELAKELIVEIIRQAGGAIDLKTAVFKAFYHAHIKFAKDQPGYLSAWPIVRMPRGPGIHRFDKLVLALVAEKRVSISTVPCGKHRGFRYTVDGDSGHRVSLPAGAVQAIAYGVAQVQGKTARQISRESHDVSRAWREANDGEELNIYLDSLDDAEYTGYTTKADEIGEAINSFWK